MDVIRTPFYQEIPQVFTYGDSHGVRRLAGAYAKLLQTFAHVHQYDLQMIAMDNYKVSRIQKNIQQGIYNISMHAGTYKNLFANISFSYPLEWSKVCIMVRAEEELPRYWYVLWPFGAYIWVVLCLFIPYVAFLLTYLKHPTETFSHNLLYGLAVMLYSSNTNLKWVNVATRIQIFYTLLLALGFILNSYYGSYLTVYNMRPIFQPYLKTVEDIVAANIEILVPSHILEELRNNPYVNLTPLESQLVDMPQFNVSSKVRQMVRKYAFVITQNEWIFLGKIQRNLIQPMYQISDVCFGNVFSGYPIEMHSKFAQSLDFFILLVQQSGLWEQWQEEAFMAATRTKYYKVLQDAYPVGPLNLYYYRLAWILFFTGNILSGICFMVETLVFRYKNKDK